MLGASALRRLVVASALLVGGCVGAEGRSNAPPAPAPLVATVPTPPSRDDASFSRPRAPAAAPYRLTASDGTGLHLVGYRARTVLEDPIAFTEIELTFENPETRVLEGHFEVRLPPLAALERFAMQVHEAWQEGEVVERPLARAAYESFLHKRRDPALLEQGAGNLFGARVFPIAAKSQKKIRLSYSEILRDRSAFRLPLLGLGAIHEVSAEVRAVGVSEPLAKLEGADLTPSADLVVPRAAPATAVGRVAGDLALVRVPLAAAAPSDRAGDAASSWIFLVDASASRSLDWDATTEVVRRQIGALPPETQVVVAAFDQAVAPLYEGPASAYAGAPASALARRGPLGASDLGAALAWTEDRVKRGIGARARVVVVGDGIATAGASTPNELDGAISGLARAGVARVDAIAVGGLRDEACLAALVGEGGEARGVVADAAWGPDEIARRLARATLGTRAVSVEGARWVFPREISGGQPGDFVTIFAELPRGRRRASLTVGDEHTTVPLAPSEPALLERAWASAKIASLEAGDDGREARARIVELSKRHRILSRYTSMLVLETEEDYARFGVDRLARDSLLATTDDGRVVVQRVLRTVPPRDRGAQRGDAPIPPPPPVGAERDDPAEALARGDATDGSAEPSHVVDAPTPSARVAAPSARPVRAPQLRMGATMVTGRLPPESVQRIVRQNFGRLRGCYDEHLHGAEAFEGRVSVAFVIGVDGRVRDATLRSSPARNEAFHGCLLAAFRSLTFPAHDTGTIHVLYPLVFGRGDDAEHTPTRGPRMRVARRPTDEVADRAPWDGSVPYAGRYARVMDLLAAGHPDAALVEARAYAGDAPDDALGFVALGQAAQANGNRALAARAYGSLVDLWPYRADMRRFAGERLDGLGDAAALDLAIDSYAKAVRDRPDHPGGHRLLAYALARRGEPALAFRAIVAGLGRIRDAGLYRGVDEILEQDVAVLAAAYRRAEPWHGAEIDAKLRELHVEAESRPTVRFVLSWETDANDVDLHVWDAEHHHAYFGAPRLPSGGGLVADVTTGYGPEALVVPLDVPHAAGPYRLGVHYYARGPMGFGMGKLEVVEHDGHGKLTFDERPYVIMSDGAGLELGSYTPSAHPS